MPVSVSMPAELGIRDLTARLCSCYPLQGESLVGPGKKSLEELQISEDGSARYRLLEAVLDANGIISPGRAGCQSLLRGGPGRYLALFWGVADSACVSYNGMGKSPGGHCAPRTGEANPACRTVLAPMERKGPPRPRGAERRLPGPSERGFRNGYYETCSHSLTAGWGIATFRESDRGSPSQQGLAAAGKATRPSSLRRPACEPLLP